MGSSLVLFFFFLLLFIRSTFQQQQTMILNSRAERAALFQLRSSLGLRTKDWPIKSDPCLTWIGVLCEDGNVIEINISGLKRTRIGNQNPSFSVDSLANFTKLISFNASGFSLPGSMPNWLGFQLKSLRFLDLRCCEISGAIPISVGNLYNLSELYLADNNLTGSIPSSFGNLLNLQCLNLSRNLLSCSVPAEIGNLPSLIILDLSSNSFSGLIPAELGNLMNLQKMVICNNNFTGELPDDLWSLTGLTFLDASDNNLIGSLPNISLIVNATVSVLNLSHNMFYGILTSVLKRASFVDLSYNYLQGKIPDYARDIAFLDKNCLRSWSSQRNLKECASFYSIKKLPFDSFGLPNCTLPPTLHKHKSNTLLAAVLGSLGFIVIWIMILIAPSYKKRKISQTRTMEGPVSRASLNLSGIGEMFSYEKIVAATDDFNNINLIKNGHSCDIFEGVLEDGSHVIIKRFKVHAGKKDFLVELDFFSKISHPRLVPLLGNCLEKDKEKFLIYKYMPKRDLSNSLYKKSDFCDDDGLKSLDWITRLKIAIGAAQGLSYLHHECFPPLVHRDVQASSILLDEKYEVRLGSLSDVCNQEGGSYSNRITKLLWLSQTSEQSAFGVDTATCAYDVYCFGKVLLELVTGKIGISTLSDSNTKHFLEGIVPYINEKKELVINIKDPSLIVDEDLLEEVWAMAIIAKSCLNPKPSRRPLMRYILKALENPIKVVREGTTSEFF